MQSQTGVAALTIEMVPQSMWGVNLRSILAPTMWTRIRKKCYSRAGHKCEVCGGVGYQGRVEAHEIWKFEEAARVQKLEGVICLCPWCHQVKHFLGTLERAKQEGRNAAQILIRMFDHIAKVNGWTDEQVAQHIDDAYELYYKRSKEPWQMDLSWLESNKEMMVP